MKTIKLFLSLCFICFFTYFGFRNFHEMGLPDHFAGMFVSFFSSWMCIFLFEILFGTLKGLFLDVSNRSKLLFFCGHSYSNHIP